MMGRREGSQVQFFYAFDLDKVVPPDHLVRQIDRVLDLSWVHKELAPYYFLDLLVRVVELLGQMRHLHLQLGDPFAQQFLVGHERLVIAQQRADVCPHLVA